MALIKTLTFEESNEVKAYMQKRGTIISLANKIENKQTLNDIEKLELSNSLINMKELLNIKALDDDTRQSIEYFVNILGNYDTSKEEVKTHEIIEKPKSVVNLTKRVENGGTSALSEYFRIRGSQLITGILAYLVLASGCICKIVPYILNALDGGALQESQEVIVLQSSVLNLIEMITRLCGTLGLFLMSISLLMDLAYICLPWIRLMLNPNDENHVKFVSSYAEIAVLSEFGEYR